MREQLLVVSTKNPSREKASNQAMVEKARVNPVAASAIRKAHQMDRSYTSKKSNRPFSGPEVNVSLLREKTGVTYSNPGNSVAVHNVCISSPVGMHCREIRIDAGLDELSEVACGLSNAHGHSFHRHRQVELGQGYGA